MKSFNIGGITADPGETGRGYLDVFDLAASSADIPVTIIRGRQDGPVVNIHAAIHGDEYEGIEAARRIAEKVRPAALSGTLVVTPVVHMSAYASGTRESPVDGKNLARVFPGNPRGTATDKLAYIFFNEVVLKCDYVIALHSGGNPNRFHPLIEYYEGPDPETGKKSIEAGRSFCVGPFDILQRIGNPPRNVTCTSEAARHGIPAIEGEMWGEGRCVEEHVQQYATATVSVLKHLGMLSQVPPSEFVPQKAAKVRHCQGEWVTTTQGGLFLPNLGIEDKVKEGQKVGVVRSADGEVVETISANQAGFIGAIRTFPLVRPGDGTVMIEREVR